MSEADALLRLISRIQRLEDLPRSGWLVSGVPNPESVAAHSYEVAVIALWLAESIGEDVDVARVLKIALLHDIGEAMTTDIPAPVKELLGRESVKAAEAKAARRVVENAPSDWAAHIDAYDSKASLEARIVKGADQIQMLARALAYERRGAGDLRRFWDREYTDLGLPLVRKVLDSLFERHQSGDWWPPDFD